MSRTKAQFKRCLRNCKANENKCRADALAHKLLSKDGGDFWKGINNISGGKCMILSDKIDDVTGQSNIANTVKSGLPATSHDRPPVLTSHIPRDGTVPFINHLPWPATCECWPPATYLCQNRRN